MIVGIANIGIHVTYWAYPLLIIYHFYMPRVIVKYSIPVIITSLALDMEQWIKLADMQLYNAKNRGRNCVMPLAG
ncbi:MAG: hypothetical protein B6D79_10500 [gamma proteobacterium symbiont of Ctena orbiculata]|nr:MAG: hypothetical protein B6D79_10500 [gamma proteobacterium symbiont of Ctena orbiculata]